MQPRIKTGRISFFGNKDQLRIQCHRNSKMPLRLRWETPEQEKLVRGVYVLQDLLTSFVEEAEVIFSIRGIAACCNSSKNTSIDTEQRRKLKKRISRRRSSKEFKAVVADSCDEPTKENGLLLATKRPSAKSAMGKVIACHSSHRSFPFLFRI